MNFPSSLLLRWKIVLRLTFFPLPIASLVLALLWVPAPSQARPVPDNTLGRTENSIVRPQDENIFQIDRGAIRGSSLFHSFESFSIEKGDEVHFLQPSATNPIDIMITRVTGANPSNINGVLRVEGNADLFFINPNGILFGPQAQLDIGGSFIATTAERISFGDTFAFQVDQPNQVPPLLSINIPTGLQFGEVPGPIENQSVTSDETGSVSGLFLSESTLGLVGGKVLLRPSSSLRVSSGSIELGSVGGGSEVRLLSDNNLWFVDYQSVDQYLDITALESFINVNSVTSVRPSSSVNIQGRNIEISSRSRIGGTNRSTGVGGNLNLFATESIEVRDNVFITQAALSEGIGGNIVYPIASSSC